MPSTTAYVPTVHHGTRDRGIPHPSCGQRGDVAVSADWADVTCKKCYKSEEWYAHYAAENLRIQQEKALTEAAVKEAIQGVFAKAREIADRRGYCDTYQSIEAEIIADLPFEIEGSEGEFEVEVEFEVTIRYTDTVTVEATSRDAAEKRLTDSPEEWVSTSLVHFVPENGYTDAVDTTVESVSAL